MIKKRVLFAIILFISFSLGLLSGSILKHKDGIYQIRVERSGISEDIINGETYSYLHSASFIVKVFYNEKEIYSESLEHLIKHKTSFFLTSRNMYIINLWWWFISRFILS